MDMDIDFSDDKIESFLTSKMEDVRIYNETLETRYHTNKTCICYHSRVDDERFCVRGDDGWKRIHNNKYALGYSIVRTGYRNYSDIKIHLDWNCEETLDFKYEIFDILPLGSKRCRGSKNCKIEMFAYNRNPDICTGHTIVVVVLEVPQYLFKLQYEISGYFKCEMGGKQFNAPLPKVIISAKDSIINNCWDKGNWKANILALISTLNQTNLVMILPEEWTASVMSTFEIHCGFTDALGRTSCKTYFLADKVSKMFDNLLIVVHPDKENEKVVFLNVYSSNNIQFRALCHHLIVSLPNTIFFPLSYYDQHLSNNASFSKELLEKFGKSMREELQLTKTISQRSSTSEQIDQYMSTVSTVEKNTDTLFHLVSNMKY